MSVPWANRVKARQGRFGNRVFGWDTIKRKDHDIPGRLVVKIWMWEVAENVGSYTCPMDKPSHFQHVYNLDRLPTNDDPNRAPWQYDYGHWLVCENPEHPITDGYPPFRWRGAIGGTVEFAVRGESNVFPPLAAEVCQLYDVTWWEDDEGGLRPHLTLYAITITPA